MNLEKIVETYNNDIILKTQELARIKSIKSEPIAGAPFGEGIRKCLDYVLNLCNELGFATKNLDGYVGYAEYGSGTELVAILVHLDVVPEGTGWTKDPYGAEIIDGKMYGRGVNDDKGAAISSIYALKSIKDSGIEMNKRFRIIFGCDEESGWEDIDYYLKNDEIPSCGFSPDGPFPIVNSEKGILRVELNKDFSMRVNDINISSLKGGERPNMVPDACECILIVNEDIYDKTIDLINIYSEIKNAQVEKVEEGLKIKTTGKSAHGSEPYYGENAISKMMVILNNLPELQVEQFQFIDFIHKYIGKDIKGEFLKINFSDGISGFLTLNLGMIAMNQEKGSATLDIRYPVTFKGQDIMDKIREKSSKYGIEARLIEDKAPLYVEEDHILIKKLSKAYEYIMHEFPELISLKGGTYARAIPNAVAFGPILPGKIDTAHQKDEYLEIEDLLISAKIYARAIYELNE